MTVTIRIRDKNNAGWQKVEAALRETAERTDLTEQLAHDGRARYTVPDNGTCLFFVTDPYGTEHKKELDRILYRTLKRRSCGQASAVRCCAWRLPTLSGIAGSM